MKKAWPLENHCSETPLAILLHSLLHNLHIFFHRKASPRVGPIQSLWRWKQFIPPKHQGRHPKDKHLLNHNQRELSAPLNHKILFILKQVLTHAEVITHHSTALSLQGHLQAAARYAPDDFIMLEVCNKSSGDWQLATLLLACRCCQMLRATPPTGTDSTPLAGDGLCLH
jgi:hypothetical protein